MPLGVSDNDLAVRVANLEKRYKNGVEATRGIDLEVARGEAVAVLGPNGAGKTTFLRQLTTELKPTAGTVEIFGIDAVKEPGKAKLLMGVTPQEAGVFETLTVREHLELFGKLKGLAGKDARIQTGALLDDLDLSGKAKAKVGELSGGQRRRVLIGLALLGNPPLLILDEPTTGLDPESRRTVWNLLKKVIAGGTTVILSTHYIEEAEQLSRRAAFINAGRIVACGTLPELRSRFPHRYRMSYTGESAAEQTHFFETFREVEDFIKAAEPAEYQIATSSLEDVYFSLVGKRLGANENGSGNGSAAGEYKK
jgi:ABC-2 type transport system ATP-binding protein